ELIDAPVHGSNAVHSRTRSSSDPLASFGFTTTPRIRIGCVSGPWIASATPVTRPIQCGSAPSHTGNRRPDTTRIGRLWTWAGSIAVMPKLPAGRRSGNVAGLGDMAQGQAEDAEVEPDPPVLRVMQGVLLSLTEVAVPSQVLDLRPGGDARLHEMFLHVPGKA